MRTFVLLIVLLLPVRSTFGADEYVRVAGGFVHADRTTVRDRDCSSTQPSALFGCVNGGDGRPLAARGEFRSSPSWEIAAGTDLGYRSRVELSLAGRPSLDLRARANFPGVTGEQPVSARASSLSALVIAAIDLGADSWLVRPFVTAGAGAAHNTMGEVRYGFPGIAADAVTITRGGSSTNFAWTAGAGVTLRLTPRALLDLGFRHSNLGEMRTSSGPATIVRPTRRLVLDIDGTRARLVTEEVSVSLRLRL